MAALSVVPSTPAGTRTITVEVPELTCERLARLVDRDGSPLELRAGRALLELAEFASEGVAHRGRCRDWLLELFGDIAGLSRLNTAPGVFAAVEARAEQYATLAMPIANPKIELRAAIAVAYVAGFRTGVVEVKRKIRITWPPAIVVLLRAAAIDYANTRMLLVDLRREPDHHAALVDGWMHGYLDATRSQRKVDR